MRNLNVAKLVAEVTKEAASRVEKIMAYDKLCKELEDEGVAISVDDWDVKYCYPIKVAKHDLSKIRRIVGRLKMDGKDMAYDFDKTNELNVTLRPMNADYPFAFVYRTKFRKGGKCEVIESVSPAHVSKSLVCTI